MTSKAKQVQADMAQDLIENYIQDLTEDHAISVLHALQFRFGWAGIMFTRGDVESHIHNCRQADDLPDLTDDEMEAAIDAVRSSFTWRKGLADYFCEEGWDLIGSAYDDYAREVVKD